jgi:hypothetical protein
MDNLAEKSAVEIAPFASATLAPIDEMSRSSSVVLIEYILSFFR